MGGGSHSHNPSGRERAIETLIDREPVGNFYRVARVLDEAIPQAHASRPNWIPRSSLVDQAFALSSYDLDSLYKFRPILKHYGGPNSNPKSNVPQPTIDSAVRERILQYQSKLQKEGKAQNAQWIQKLQDLWNTAPTVTNSELLHVDTVPLEIQALVESLQTHPIYENTDDTLEASVSNVVQNLTDAVDIVGALVSVLNLVLAVPDTRTTATTDHKKKQLGDAKSEDVVQHDDEPFEFTLQVGALLSLLPESAYPKHAPLFQYFGTAAAVYEERLELVAAQRPPTSIEVAPDPPVVTEDEEGLRSSDSPPPLVSRSAVDSEDDDEENEESTVEQVEEPSGRRASVDSSDWDNEEEDEDLDQEDEEEDLVQQSSSDSSSDSSEDEEENVLDEEEEEENDDTDGEDEAALREALVLSAAATEEAASLSLPDAPEAASVPEASSLIESSSAAAIETPVSGRSRSGEEEAEVGLPSLPTPPSEYPFGFKDSISGNVPPDPDAAKPESVLPIFDPAELSEFGAVPVQNVIAILLGFVENFIQNEVLRATDEPLQQDVEVFAGGMGTTLFAPEEYKVTSREMTDQSGATVTMQILVSLLLLLTNQRIDAIENLQKAISREQRLLDGRHDDDEEDSTGAPFSSSGEADDPAMALAMNYVESDVPLSSESLENKGMRRKALAAAHDAAMLQRNLKKRTEAWKDQVRFYSNALLCVMKALRGVLLCEVRDSLEKDSKSNSIDKPWLVGHAEFFPPLIASRITTCLTSLWEANLGLRALPDVDEAVRESNLLPMDLYRESIFLWGEMVPILYPTPELRSELLLEHVKLCTQAANLSKYPTLDACTSCPLTREELTLHKLLVLCRRLRTGDMMSATVSVPIPCLSSDDDDKVDEKALENGPKTMSSIILALSDFRSVLAQCEEARALYLAMCHRYHSRVLLYDGFYAASGTSVDSVLASTSAAKALSTGDALRVSTQTSVDLQFDTAKCSDSIALTVGPGESGAQAAKSSSAHQRASKVWGAVLATRHYSPRSGVHRWAVRLDKCERGHVFIGVATSQASTRTYVGGDRYGWGMIGTQALWHDRRKIRGDYGATFRTGSTIIVTLDSDAGTLSFSTWTDGSSSSSFSLDPLLQNLLSPKRSGQVVGTVEDWGVAFEGLPLDSRLYPAVGLYQRDDRVTLLHVENSSGSIPGHSEMLAGACYYPRPEIAPDGKSSYESLVGHFNELLTWDGVQYVASFLSGIEKRLKSGDIDDYDLLHVLPSLSAALCLLPKSVPILSARSALVLMPHVRRCVLELERHYSSLDTSANSSFHAMRGKWKIRATGSSSGDFEEYIVDFRESKNDGENSLPRFEASGVGTSGRSENSVVRISGCANGSAITFLEEWARSDDGLPASSSLVDDASSCVVAARLNVDGRRFEGVYRNVLHGTAGQIAGVSLDAGDTVSVGGGVSTLLTRSAVLLCLAQGHLSTIIGEISMGDVEQAGKYSGHVSPDKKRNLLRFLHGSVFSRCGQQQSDDQNDENTSFLRGLYTASSPSSDLCGLSVNALLLEGAELIRKQAGYVQQLPLNRRDFIVEMVEKFDQSLASISGGYGSLQGLCRACYSEARKSVICCLLSFGGIKYLQGVQDFSSLAEETRVRLCVVWRSAMMTMEAGLRQALSREDGGSRSDRCVELCRNYTQASVFVISLEKEPSLSSVPLERLCSEIGSLFLAIETQRDLEFLEESMQMCSRHGFLRCAALNSVNMLIQSTTADRLILLESLCEALPRQVGGGKGHLARETIGYKGGDVDVNGPRLASSTAGCSLRIRRSWSSLALEAFQLLGQTASSLLERDASSKQPSCNSFLLSYLAIFVRSFRSSELAHIISNTSSGIVALLPRVLATNRNSVHRQPASDIPVDRSLPSICQRDISRAVLRVAVSVSHALAYQVAANDNLQSDTAIFDILVVELGATFEVVKEALDTLQLNSISRRRDEEWDHWLRSQFLEAFPENRRASVDKMVESQALCLEYLLDVGTTVNSVQGPPAKVPSHKSSSRHHKSTKKLSSSNATVFPTYYLSHWLHVVATVLGSTSGLKIVSKDKRWLSCLLPAVGLTQKASKSGELYDTGIAIDSLLPTRFRARILRLMRPLLAASSPSVDLAEKLFCLTGVYEGLPIVDDERGVRGISQECVSLLRQLHSPRYPRWRGVVNTAIASIAADCGNDPDCIRKRVGLASFFSGRFDSLMCGSFVLLKPAASTALAPEQQSSSAGKGHPSGMGGGSLAAPTSGSTPHHVVGNGTDGVVSGLCKKESAAGIVSNIDLKGGLCEIVLLDRSSEWYWYEDTQEIVSTDDSLLRVARSGGRSTLTVRALRTPLDDVAIAQEVPLFLDESIPVPEILSAVLRSLESIFAKLRNTNNDPKELKDAIGSFAADTMIVRCGILLLSDERLASNDDIRSLTSDAIQKALSVAWPEQGVSNPSRTGKIASEGISSLRICEARIGHLVRLLRDVLLRSKMIDQTSDPEKSARVASFKTHLQTFLDNEKSQDSDGQVENRPGILASSRGEANESSRDGDITSSRSISQSTGGSASEDEEDAEAAATAAAHLREAAIAQMAELGLPRSWSELALRRTGGVNIEAAVAFCLERGAEIERMLAEEQERDRIMQRDGSGGSSRRRSARDMGPSSRLLRQLLEMGFPRRWCTEALAVTGNNVDEALTWILNNGERLSEEDEALEAGAVDDPDNDSGDDEDDTEHGDASTDGEEDNEAEEIEAEHNQDVKAGETAPAWKGSIIPIRFISGRAIVDPVKMEVSGLPSGGFSSVGTKGVLLTTGKWYYEAVLKTAGCLQIGWADGSFAAHCHADRGDGCGDGPSSWAFDGWRRYRWHATATEWGSRWKEGDVVGCLVDMDQRQVSFTLNGEGESIGMGVAFSGEGFRPCSGVYACISFNRKEKLKLILGGPCSEPFRYAPPTGYRGVGEAVVEAAEDRDRLIAKERLVESPLDTDNKLPRRFLCDFSDEEHGHELMAWAHRYYGSDASVHLGAGRSRHSSSKHIGSSNECTVGSCMAIRLRDIWSRHSQPRDFSANTNFDAIVSYMRKGYEDAERSVLTQLSAECEATAVLLCRKLVLHAVIAQGRHFRSCCMVDRNGNRGSFLFWKTIETCTSLRSAGWVGEAGAMAMAAEALGLGISSADQTHTRSSGERSGVFPAADLDPGLHLAAGGVSQVLESIVIPNMSSTAVETGSLCPASAEASMSSDGGGGLLAFLLDGLQTAICESPQLRAVIIAAVRKAVRSLAAVEYENDDFDTKEDTISGDGPIDSPEEKTKTTSGDENEVLPGNDARLVSFMSGLLLSKRVKDELSDFNDIQCQLAEAWSVGLLSASLPWRMVCASTVAGILNSNPKALVRVLQTSQILARYFGRFQSTAARRLWSERAAFPVCSRYSQSLVELLRSVERALKQIDKSQLTRDFLDFWGTVQVDAATPVPVSPKFESVMSAGSFWETAEGWVASDSMEEVWTGFAEYHVPEDWNAPPLSSVHRLMDGGDGPPMLGKDCTVLRGVDWDEELHGDVDGKSVYDKEKAARDREKRQLEVQEKSEKQEATKDDSKDVDNATAEETATSEGSTNPNDIPGDSQTPESPAQEPPPKEKPPKKARLPSPKLPIGTVLSIEPWNGVPGMARRVQWKLTGKEGVYRFGGEGGKFDLLHVETNSRGTKVKKKHPLPESNEQCMARHGFGTKKKFSLLLRMSKEFAERDVDGQVERVHEGILEWPDFGAGAKVECTRYEDGAVSLKEQRLLFGSNDSGWECRFGQPSYVAGSEVVLTPTKSSRRDSAAADDTILDSFCYDEFLGSISFDVKFIENPSNGRPIRLVSDIQLRRCSESSSATHFDEEQANFFPPPISFDREFHAPSLAVSRDGRTVSCISSDGRASAFASVGFTKGVHYWEVKIEQTSDIGSVFIGVAEKPCGSGSGSSFRHDTPPRLNRWHGFGFVNFRATFASGAERVYGSHCHSGDTVGVLLDCDAGRLSFFYDGLKYGEHILNDLGCAFENLSPFGFNVDGCGSGGAGQGAPSGFENGSSSRYPAQGTIRPRTLWPVVGLRNQGDRITFSSKWTSSFGVDGTVGLRNILRVSDMLDSYNDTNLIENQSLPEWIEQEAYTEYSRWIGDCPSRSSTRGSGPYRSVTIGLDVDFDTTPLACAAASAGLGLGYALLAGDRVRLTRSAGRILELAEEALVLGVYQSKLFYRIVSQKSEGGSLTEGGGRAWCWDESEVVDGLPFVEQGKGRDVPLPTLNRFICMASGGLRVIYQHGAVVRSDLEIFDGSISLGTIPAQTVLPRRDVVERRVNSCGVVRFRVKYQDIEGWISARIRGGSEECIVQPVHEKTDDKEEKQKMSFASAKECAAMWHEKWLKLTEDSEASDRRSIMESLKIDRKDDFRTLVEQACIPGLSLKDSDAVLTAAMNCASNCMNSGDDLDVSFLQVASAFSFALKLERSGSDRILHGASVSAQQAVATALSPYTKLPTLKATMARMALLRAINRRIRVALPWLSVRPCQEGSAILGGLSGHGASPDRAGRRRNKANEDSWVQLPCSATQLRSIRKIVFTSVKRSFLLGILDSTTTPTPLSHDEYELPREIRTVRINRLKAGRAMVSDDRNAKRKHSVFTQLFNETKSWGGAALRRGYIAKGHGGQKRAFKVKLVGEGVNDYSGPYRECFTDAISEVLKTEQDGRGVLGVLDQSPNNANSLGEERDLFVFSLNGRKLDPVHSSSTDLQSVESRIRSSFASLLTSRDESSREVEDALVFLGRITGTAFRHGIPLDLPLPLQSIWKALTEEYTSPAERLREVDYLAYRQLEDERDAELSPILRWQQRMLNSFAEGLSHVLPIELFPLMTGEELRASVCGNTEVDVGLLQQVVEYEHYHEHDATIIYFWETLFEMSNDERTLFLQFVWARNRLPLRASDFEAPFKIVKDSMNEGERADQALPSASTCFFSLTLPEYSSRSILQEKLLFAISNVTTMETDFQTNAAEISEGYQAF